MSILDEALPPLEDLEPEELRYLREICKRLGELDYPESRARRSQSISGLFDADELGLCPEDDEEYY